jgi:HEAT repeat protein
MKARIDHIVRKLGEARKRRLSCFGSDAHRFELRAPIDEAKLVAFELARGVELPACYRSFLLSAGHGGAGPYYGLFTLDRWDDFATWVIDDVPDDFVARRCVLRPGRNGAVADDSETSALEHYGGTIALGSQGCSLATLLIVTGAHRGRVAYVDADGSPPYVVREPDFLAWYERWLDELLGGYETSWYGYGPGGDEATLLALLDDRASDEELRGEAAAAMSRLPRLSERGARRLPALCADGQAGVRSAACAAITRFELTSATDAVASCLDDVESAVRNAAVRAAAAVDIARFAPRLLEMACAESDPDVALGAVLALNQAGALTRDARVRIVASSPHGSARSQAAHALSWERRDVALLLSLLGAEDPATRMVGVTGLRTVGAREAVPAMAELLSRESTWFVAASLIHALGELGDASVVPVLLGLAEHGDDFHRLDALGALAKLGDERAIPIARAMLTETRKPVRRDASGFTSQTAVDTIGDLAARALRDSSSKRLRDLVARPRS